MLSLNKSNCGILLLLLCVLTTPVFCQTVATEPAGWQDGSGGNISSLAELRWLSETPEAWDEDWIQTADIDAAETRAWNDSSGFSSIGRSTQPFTGSYHGNGYKIEAIYMNDISPRTIDSDFGFFNYLNNATVNMLYLEDVLCYSRNQPEAFGALAGRATSCIIKNCYVTMNSILDKWQSLGRNTGGLIGNVKGCEIRNMTIHSHYNGGFQSGGAFGIVDSSSVDSVNVITTLEFCARCGGLAGVILNSMVSNCEIICNESFLPFSASGFAQEVENSKIEFSFVSGSINVYDSEIHNQTGGGFIGSCTNSHVERCATSLDITISDWGHFDGFIRYGGFVGSVTGSIINNVFAHGSINEVQPNVASEFYPSIGGFIYRIYPSTEDSSKISNVYTNVEMNIEIDIDEDTAVASFSSSPITDYYTSCYFNIEKNPDLLNHESDEVKGLTNYEFAIENFFTNWDFMNIWQMTYVNGTVLPLLRDTPGHVTPVTETKVSDKNIISYPNPASTELFFDNNKQLIGATYSITTLEGIIVQRGSVKNNHIKLKNLYAGVYAVFITTKIGNKYSNKILVK